MELLENSPIFVGGTGRSGTSVMGDFLNSHTDIVLPSHENKLIVDHFGLRCVVDTLSAGYDHRAHHFVIRDFIRWAQILRKTGFRNPFVKRGVTFANKISRRVSGKPLSDEKLCRSFPAMAYSLHAIGEGYGLEHYDRCVESFLDKLIGSRDDVGVFNADGLVRPVYAAATLDREALLGLCRDFLAALYDAPLAKTGARRWCDDTPMNVGYAPFLVELYPDARIMHMVRDPRDVFLSYTEQTWASGDTDATLTRLTQFYSDLISKESELPAGSLQIYRLEDIVSDFDHEKARLADFLNIDPDGFDGRVTFRAGSLGRYKDVLPAETAARIDSELGFAIKHFGYS